MSDIIEEFLAEFLAQDEDGFVTLTDKNGNPYKANLNESEKQRFAETKKPLSQVKKEKKESEGKKPESEKKTEESLKRRVVLKLLSYIRKLKRLIKKQVYSVRYIAEVMMLF